VLTLWGGGGFGARSADVPGIIEPQEKELSAGPLSLLVDDGSGGCGVAFPGDLELGPPMTVYCYTNKQTNDNYN
jgi:hypothetical protein